ncbi:helix-turn-helix domain-containing protein [Candidatus Bathyarchaeota archaeon]|nr:helix-turn-helix domain-containing protein [Candidatus Bathyarchaeota archaeon]
MSEHSIQKVANALADETRVKIISTLNIPPPLSFTELLNLVGLSSFDTNKLSYHLGILQESQLITKQNEKYRITETGREIYNSLDVRLDEWEEIAYRDSLRGISVVNVVGLIWGQHYWVLGIPIAFLWLFNRDSVNPIFYLFIFLGTAISLGLNHTRPKLEFENDKKTIIHLSKLLLPNDLLPKLILQLGGVSMVYLAFMIPFHLSEEIPLNMIFTMILVANSFFFGAGIWLSKLTIETWRSIKNGEKIKNYSKDLELIRTIAIIFYLLIGIFLISQNILDRNILGPNIGIFCMHFSGAFNLLKKK